jgi:4-hydroxyacetophenone monooxygenase
VSKPTLLLGKQFPNIYTDWGKKFAPQHEIATYYGEIAKKHGLDQITNFDVKVDSADWDDGLLLWVLHTTDLKSGQKKIWTCNVV